MGSKVTPVPLSQRLKEGESPRWLLRANPPAHPFWIPEENPLLRTWDVSIGQYCQTVQRATYLNLRRDCSQIFTDTWPDLDALDWAQSLITMLGHAYRLTHPEGQEEGELRYVPDPDPPKVWGSWRNSSIHTGGKLINQKKLEEALAHLMLSPFYVLHRRIPPKE